MVAKTYFGPQVPNTTVRTGNAGAPAAPVQAKQQNVQTGKTQFQKILEKKSSGLQFSGHAVKRLEQRGIKLSENELTRLDDAVVRARSKGSRESLVLLNDLAFVVSVSNRTVITAIDSDSMKENVVTNIDSAVIA